jgi:serine O-acetyltransferase
MSRREAQVRLCEPNGMSALSLVRRLLRESKADTAFLMAQSGRELDSLWVLRWLLSPSLRAAFLFRRCGNSSGWKHIFWRHVLLTASSCDVSSGAEFGGPLYIPHPIGIVIGCGTKLGTKVSIFQNVTLGRDGSGRYPTIGANTNLFAGCVVVGGINVEAGSRIAANRVVNYDYPPKK